MKLASVEDARKGEKVMGIFNLFKKAKAVEQPKENNASSVEQETEVGKQPELNPDSSLAVTKSTKPIRPTKEKDYDVVIPSKKDGATLAYQYSVLMLESNIDAALKAAQDKQWYLTASIVDGNIHLFSGDDDLGALIQRADMMKDWLRRGDPYLAILENVNSETGCTVRLVFYRDKKQQYANREQSVVALVSYKSEEKQDNLAGLEEGDEVDAEEDYEKEDCIIVSSTFGPIGNLPKKYAKRFIEDGADLVVFDHSEEEDDFKEKPFVRIYW